MRKTMKIELPNSDIDSIVDALDDVLSGNPIPDDSISVLEDLVEYLGWRSDKTRE